ncbi:uncharacterized protein LOC134267457 [Saccostrea cucullata]|uniref:uncharacterized protein LOC134267457 n=1 Tax=Saccostrea cuccullata TaxID=36930 RepID=UPI002ED0A701
MLVLEYVFYRRCLFSFSVNKIESNEGESKHISWNVDYIPVSGSYHILHYNSTNGSYSNIIDIINWKINIQKSQKYAYHSKPITSTRIQFEVKDITVADAGHYVGGYSPSNALSKGDDAVLIVYGKPQKPVISGEKSVKVNTEAFLECESSSTSAPKYYKFPPLSYSWFVNNTKLNGEVRETYRFTVSRNDTEKRYSCQAEEKNLESERSGEIQINPLYGPESVIITSHRVGEELEIKDGDFFGPYTCSADCNPACTLRWQYKNPSGYFEVATQADKASITLSGRVDRTRMRQIQCVANNSVGQNNQTINLNILYLSDPVVNINSSLKNESTVHERNFVHVSCSVGGNPTPDVTLRKLTGDTLTWNGNLKHTWIKEAQCSDTGTYNCEGSSTEFGSKDKTFSINVLCDPRLEDSNLFKSNYGSMSGPGVKVVVNLPVVANPLESTSGFVWSGPAFQRISINVSQRDNIVYKHWINSTIPIPNTNFFGNYWLIYKEKAIANITINAQDKPQPPLNFSWYSYGSGFINLTWISNFNGGPEQFFILANKKEKSWTFVKNLTDPGEGSLGYYDLGPLVPEQEYWYQLESCNRISCSLSPREIKVKVKAPPISSFSLFGDNTMLILVGASAAGFVFVVVLTVAVTMYCKTTKKSATKKINMEERPSGSTEQDDIPADVVVYAAVDKSVLMKNRQQDDVVKSDVIKDQNDDNDTMYSEVIKHPKKQKQTDEKKKKELQGKNEEAGASTSNDNSRSTNQDGLVYIDVEFAKKPQSSDTKGRPVIHGEDEKTEYTFVDFSQKAPPSQETQENVK